MDIDTTTSARDDHSLLLVLVERVAGMAKGLDEFKTLIQTTVNNNQSALRTLTENVATNQQQIANLAGQMKQRDEQQVKDQTQQAKLWADNDSEHASILEALKDLKEWIGQELSALKTVNAQEAARRGVVSWLIDHLLPMLLGVAGTLMALWLAGALHLAKR